MRKLILAILLLSVLIGAQSKAKIDKPLPVAPERAKELSRLYQDAIESRAAYKYLLRLLVDKESKPIAQLLLLVERDSAAKQSAFETAALVVASDMNIAKGWILNVADWQFEPPKSAP